MATLFGGIPCIDPAQLRESCVSRSIPTDSWWGKANSFAWGLGEKPGEGHILLRLADLDTIDLTTDHALEFANDAGANTDPVTLARITLIDAECVTPGAEGDEQAVFVCKLNDRRFHLARIPVDKAYNLSSADGESYLTQTKNGGSAWTWAQVVQDLWTALGLGTAPSLPFTPHGTPENLTYYGGFAWRAINDVMNRIGCGIKYDPTADSFAFVRLGEVDAASDAAVASLKRNLKRVWDGYPVNPERGRRPEKVRVRFPRRPLPTDGSSPWYTVDVTLPAAAGVVSGTYAQIDDDLTALGATGTPSNSATLATRASERATDWARKQQGYDDRYLVVYRDFQPAAKTILGSRVGAVGFDDRGRVMRTAARAMPDGAMESFHPFGGLPIPYPPGSSGGWHARITTASSGKWKYYKLTLDSSGNEVDDGAESAGFTATPLTIDGTNLCNPVGGMRVWMWASKQTGKQEFIPIGYASLTLPGLVSIGAQTFNGAKTFDDAITFSSTTHGVGAATFDSTMLIKSTAIVNDNAPAGTGSPVSVFTVYGKIAGVKSVGLLIQSIGGAGAESFVAAIGGPTGVNGSIDCLDYVGVVAGGFTTVLNGQLASSFGLSSGGLVLTNGELTSFSSGGDSGLISNAVTGSWFAQSLAGPSSGGFAVEFGSTLYKGAHGTFLTGDTPAKTVTVKGGIITGIA